MSLKNLALLPEGRGIDARIHISRFAKKTLFWIFGAIFEGSAQKITPAMEYVQEWFSFLA
jgi:hypothetical protein